MLTETVLGRFKNNIISEELHLAHGTKSAKVITHVDLDGVVSGISMVQQLVRQGIKKDRITVEFAQYGDDEKQKKLGKDEADKFLPKNKSQFVGVTDYAKYPTVKPFEEFKKLTGFKGKPYEFIRFVKSTDFSNMAKNDFENLLRKSFTIEDTKFTDRGIDQLYKALKAYYKWGKKDRGEMTPANVEKYIVATAKPEFGSDHHSNEDGKLSAAYRGDLAANAKSEAEFFANKYAPGLWSQDDLAAVSMVDSAGYTEEELKNTIFLKRNLLGPNKKRNLATLVSIVYDSLAKKDEKVAKWIILNAQPSLVSLYNTTIRGLKFNGERLRMAELIRAACDGRKDKDGKPNPDWKGWTKDNKEYMDAKGIAETLPKILSKNWHDPDGDQYKNRNGDPIKPAGTVEGFREKNIQDLEDAKTGYYPNSKKEEAKKAVDEAKKKAGAKYKSDPEYKKANENLNLVKAESESKRGKIAFIRNFAVFDGSNKRINYGRYMTSLLSIKGQRMPYVIRYWPNSMFQVAVNTIYKQGCHGQDVVDFSKVKDKVMEDLRKFLKEQEVVIDNKKIPAFHEMTINNIIDEISDNAGGHKGAIYTFSKFDKIKAPNKHLGSYWDDYDKVKRADEIVARREKKNTSYGETALKRAETIIPKTAGRVREMNEGVLAQYKDIQKKAFQYALNQVVHRTNELYPPKPEGLEALKNSDERFEMNV